MATIDALRVDAALSARREDITALLCDLIRVPSMPGSEGPAMERMFAALQDLADVVEYVPVTEAIRQDPDFSYPVADIKYGDRPCIRAIKKGGGSGKSLLFNTHLDVVPPSSMHEKPFEPQVVDGVVFGRGACDAKGQAVTAWALLRLLKDLDVTPGGDITFHFVIEEEVGGNGSVAMVRTGDKADAAIVLEPTEFVILPQVRGAVWFETTIYGQSGHSGKPGGTVSALLKSIIAIQTFTKYHDRCIAESRGKYPLFDQFENPAPLTIGQLQAGDWPAQAPQKSVFKGVLGILPDRTKEQVMDEMRQALRDAGDPWLAENFEMEFTYRHDANVIEPDHPLVQGLEAACNACGQEPKVSAMTASCDAWLYNNQLKIPTVVFGPGSLGVAHSNQEQIAVDDILKAARVLASFVGDWCGAVQHGGNA